MQNSEKQKFEETWRSAFDGAEMTPPDRVWNSIELDLAGQESATMKKRVVFYQRLAAATVLFALLSGVYAFYPRGGEEKQLVKTNTEGTNSKQPATSENTQAADDKPHITDKSASITSNQTASKTLASNGKRNSGSNQQSASTTRSTSDQPTLDQPIIDIKEIIVLNDPSNVAATNDAQPAAFTQTEVVESQQVATVNDNGTVTDSNKTDVEKKTNEAVVSPLLQTAPLVTSLEPEETTEPKEKKSHENNLWLALGGAAGNYSPNTPTATTTPSGSQFSFTGAGPMANPQNIKPEPKVGSSYSMGLAVGKKFGRVVLQTGVNLNKQQVEFTSNYDSHSSGNSAKAASMDYLAETANANAQLAFTNEYTVNSTMEIISIPVQAGYMIIDRKLGWQINAGFSPDFFLRNILVDKSGQRERFTQSAGSESPYRSVNWSGLANTEISYRLGTHYRLSLVPGVRYSFNSILKEPTNNGRPVILDVGFRFKYLFE